MTHRHWLPATVHRYLRVPYTLNVHEYRSPKKPVATFVFIHGIGNTLHSWDEVVARLPSNVRLIGIDLLGFGESPKPDWAVYNAKTQARSVGVTLLKLRLTQQPILVGHSLGALVAVEVAKRYPLIVRRLVLCSPPFYSPLSNGTTEVSGISRDTLLRKLYRIAQKHPEQLEALSPLAVKLGLANKALNITKDNVASYIGALESSIINQTSLSDAERLRVPIDIFYGILDPVVIKKHITYLARRVPGVSVTKLTAGHEIIGSYTATLAEHLRSLCK